MLTDELGRSHSVLDPLSVQITRIVLHDDPLLAASRHGVHICTGAHLCLATIRAARIGVLYSIVFRFDNASTQRLKWERRIPHLRCLLAARRVGGVVCGSKDAGQDFRHEGLACREAAADDTEACFDAHYCVECRAVP